MIFCVLSLVGDIGLFITQMIFFVLSHYLELCESKIGINEKESSCSINIEIEGEKMNSQKFQEIIDENRELRECERSLYVQNRILLENEALLQEENMRLSRLCQYLAEELAFIYES